MFVAPGDDAALASAMRALLDDGELRAVLGRRARARAESLSWARGAEAALGALREAAA